MSKRVLFLPGYGESAAMARPFTDVQETMLDFPLDVVDYYGNDRQISPGATKPSDALAAIALRYVGKHDSVHILGHSYGSLVAASLVAELGEQVESVSLIAPAGIHPDSLAIVPRFTYDLAHLSLSSMHNFAARQALNIVKSPLRSTREAFELATQDGAAADVFDPARTLIIAYQNDRVFHQSKLSRAAMKHGLPLAMPLDANGEAATHSQPFINPTMTARTVARHIAAHQV